jgi:hypothetical protein
MESNSARIVWRCLGFGALLVVAREGGDTITAGNLSANLPESAMADEKDLN